jgi:hypothetical protein
MKSVGSIRGSLALDNILQPRADRGYGSDEDDDFSDDNLKLQPEEEWETFDHISERESEAPNPIDTLNDTAARLAEAQAVNEAAAAKLAEAQAVNKTAADKENKSAVHDGEGK